jgi:hypothetical protein
MGRYPFSGHFQKCKETRITVMGEIFGAELLSKASTIPNSVNLCESPYTCQSKFLFSAMMWKFLGRG